MLALRRLLFALHGLFTYRLLPRLAYVLGHLRRPQQLVSRWPEGDMKLGPRVAVYVHWDGAGAVREHVLNQVRALHAAGCSVVFVTNSGRLRPDATDALKPFCAGILVRRNIGYDFGAWREGFEVLALPRPDTELVIMTNDSMYGPVNSVADALDRMDLADADVWGMTESWQGRYHLQSYFVAFAPHVLASKAWHAFWTKVLPAPSKHWVIHRYEIGLTQDLLKGGFRSKVLWPYTDLVNDVDPEMLVVEDDSKPNSGEPAIAQRRAHARRIRDSAVLREPLNPTHDLWRQLLRAGFPYLKRELMRDNPAGISDLTDWREEVRAVGGDTGPIERDLRRSLRNKAP